MSREAATVGGVRTDARLTGSMAAGVFKAGDGRGTVRVAPPAVDPMTRAPAGVPACRGLNAVVLQKPFIPADDVGLVDGRGPVTEATDDPCDRAHAVTDARGELVCSARVVGSRKRVYHRGDMVTRYRVRLAALPDGRRVRSVASVERVSFETRECDLAARERRLRNELGPDVIDGLGFAVGGVCRSAGRAWEL